MTYREEMAICAFLDSLQDCGYPVAALEKTARRAGVNWKPRATA